MISLHLPAGLVPHHVEVLQSRRMGISTHEWSFRLHFQGGYFVIGGLHKSQVSQLRGFLEEKFLPMLRKIEFNGTGTCSGGLESPGARGDVQRSE